MVRHRFSDEPLFKPMTTKFIDAYIRHSAPIISYMWTLIHKKMEYWDKNINILIFGHIIKSIK